MLNRKESFVEIWGEDRSRGIVYGQNQDDGTGRLVRRNFNNLGWEVDDRGKIIDPDYISPEEEARLAAEATKVIAPVVQTEPELLIADRIKITNPNSPGYLEVEDLQKELRKMDVGFHHKAGREKLMIILKEELNLTDGMENR